jgi:hypothetical protein
MPAEEADKIFKAALAYVKNAKDLEVTTDQQLVFYGFFKCATVGTCEVEPAAILIIAHTSIYGNNH